MLLAALAVTSASVPIRGVRSCFNLVASTWDQGDDVSDHVIRGGNQFRVDSDGDRDASFLPFSKVVMIRVRPCMIAVISAVFTPY